MAVSLITNPGSFLPAYNPIQWVVSSTNTARCDFLYICDVYVNGVFVIRLQAEPGYSDYGYIRIERVLQDYLSQDFKYNTISFEDNSNSAVEYYLEIRERYNSNYATTCVGDETISAVLYTSPTCIAWNGALQFKERREFDVDNYVLDSTLTKFLNRTPNRLRIPIDGLFVASFLQVYSAVPAVEMEIKTYTQSFVLINTYSILNNGSPLDTGPHTAVGVGPENINGYSRTLSPSVDWIDGDVYFYTVQILDNYSLPVSEAMLFEIDRRCTKFNQYRIWWFNRAGSWNSYHFNMIATRNVDSVNNTYTKLLDVDYEEKDRGETVMSVDSREAYLFQTDRMRKNEADWIEDLYTSGDIYVVDSNAKEMTAEIIGAVYNAGTASFVLNLPLATDLPVGTTFTYVVDDGSPIGMANAGSGIITGYNTITGYYETDVPSTINAGGFINGYMVLMIAQTAIIPMVRSTARYEDKSLPQSKPTAIQYSIELRPSYELNIQTF